MSEELVVRQCAPTLAGIKTGSLFSCPCDSPEELRQEVRAARAAQGQGEAGTALSAIERELHHCALEQELAKTTLADIRESDTYKNWEM